MSTLICEGGTASADHRILAAILRGSDRPEILWAGGKGAIPGTIKCMRQIPVNVYGIRDADFPEDPNAWTPSDDPAPWEERQNDGKIVHLGWVWCRKEIENYVFDPSVLAQTFKWGETHRRAYTRCLESVFDEIGPLSAARMALTACLPARNRARTGSTELPFSNQIDALIGSMKRQAEDFRGASIDGVTLEAKFHEILPECTKSGGRFRAHAQRVFAGKDVASRLAQLQEIPHRLKEALKVRQNEARGRSSGVVEAVIAAMEADDAPHLWLPEWVKLRAAILTWSPAGL